MMFKANTIAKVDTMLTSDINKIRNKLAFERFINQEITKRQDFLKDELGSAQKKNNFKDIETFSLDDGTIVTREYCNVPFRFIQSETAMYPDGSKTHARYYASEEQIPAKVFEYSAMSTIVKITTFDNQGNAKTIERRIKNNDGTQIEEQIDVIKSRKSVRKINQNNVTTELMNYANEKLTFHLQCDNFGNLLKETTFYTCGSKPTKLKEIVYHGDIAYTETEYNALGEISSVFTQRITKR